MLLFHIRLRDKVVWSHRQCLCVVQYIAQTIPHVTSATTRGQLTVLRTRAFLTHVTPPHRVTFSSGQMMNPGGAEKYNKSPVGRRVACTVRACRRRQQQPR